MMLVTGQFVPGIVQRNRNVRQQSHWIDLTIPGKPSKNNLSRIDRFTKTMCSQQKDPTDTMPPRKFIDRYLK